MTHGYQVITTCFCLFSLRPVFIYFHLGKDDSNSEKVSEKELEQRLVDNANKHMSKENSSRLHLTEVEVVTGEEGERNVLQVCPLLFEPVASNVL